MSWLSSFLHPEKGYQAAQEQMDKYYNQAQQYQQPYMNHGEEAYGGLSGAMNALLDPQALQSKWAEGYEASPYALQQAEMAKNQGLDAASSMGLMGSSPALQSIQAGTSNIMNQDRQQYLDNLMQKYLAGAGLAQGIYGTGANAAGQMAQNAMNMGQNSAQMKFGEQNAQGDLFGNMVGGIGGIIGGPLASKFGQMIGAPQQPSYGWQPYGQAQGMYRY